MHALFRQRRRSLTCASLFTLTVLVGTMTNGVPLAHLPLWVLPTATVLFFLICAGVVAVLVLLFPGIRTLWEVLGLFTLLEALFIWLAPQTSALIHDVPLRIAISIGVITLIHLALYGRLLDRVPALFSFAARETLHIGASSQTVWNAVVPQQATKAHHWAGRQFDVFPDPDEPDTLHLRTPIGPDQVAIQSVTFVHRQRPHHCRYYFTSDMRDRDLSEGIYDFKITPRSGGVQLEIRLHRTGARLREMLYTWFDDALGAQADALKRRLEGQPIESFGVARWRQTGALV